MIEQVKHLLQEHQLRRVVIIDDAYDAHPHASDVESEQWDRFWNDLTDAEEAAVARAYGADKYKEQDISDLRREQSFVEALWNQRTDIRAAQVLFEEFEAVQAQRRSELEPLRAILDELGMTCQLLGRDDAPDDDTDIVFLDLFLGFQDIDDSLARAIEQLKGIIDQRRATPPAVVLLSRSPRLEEAGPAVRDQARLLGCQFRMLKKSDLTEQEQVLERIYELAVSRPDSLKLNAFVLAWEAALDGGKETFLHSIRRLDLPDYANVGELVLKAESEPLGYYILDLYDLHFHALLEGNEALMKAARALNEIDPARYPPPQFIPSPETDEMMDGALFENQVRTRVEVEVPDLPPRLGDVFLAPQPPSSKADEAAAVPAHQYAYVVLSQACDLKHGDAEQILLMRGVIKPYSATHHENHLLRTPVMKDGGRKLAVEWDVLTPETWSINELADKIEAGHRRIRRFRTPYALQLQQAFSGNLSRVGTLTAVPARYPVGVKVFLRTSAGTARLLTEACVDTNDAVWLVGRTRKNTSREWLMLSPILQKQIRQGLKAVPPNDLPTAGGPVRLATVVADLNFYRLLQGGMDVNRRIKGSKPFSESAPAYDVLQIITSPQFETGGTIGTEFRPLVFQIELN